MKAQINFILLPLLLLTAALAMVKVASEMERAQMAMEEQHLALIKARGFGYNGSLKEMLDSLCNGSFSTYVVEINISNNSLCNGPCERLACGAKDFYCHHCVIAIEGNGSSIMVRRVEP